MNKIASIAFAAVLLSTAGLADEPIGTLSANPYAPNSTSNPYSPAGSPYSPTSVHNPYGQYGSQYSNTSATNPYATDAPKLYDANGNYRGKLSSNTNDPESVSNPYGRYGSPYSPDSIKNPYGAGNPYRADSPNNPYGNGLTIVAPSNAPAVPRNPYAIQPPAQTPVPSPYAPRVPNQNYGTDPYGTPATPPPTQTNRFAPLPPVPNPYEHN